MSLGSFATGLAGMTGAFDADAPPDRSYHDERDMIIRTQLKQLPQVYGGEAEYQPKYAELASDIYGKTAQNLFGMLTGQFAPAMREQERLDRAAYFSDFGRLAPGARGTLDEINPAGSNLLATLLGNAQAEVDRGMSPGEMRDVQQAIRAGQAARGVGYGPSDQYDEVYGVGLASRGLRRQAAQDAAGMTELSKGYYNDPILNLFGNARGSGAGTAGQAFNLASGVMSGAGPRLINPESAYAGNLYGMNYQGALQTELTNAQLRQKYAEQAGSGGDSVVGGLMGMFL